MQDCFRLHPELYGSELEDDEDEIEDELLARENASSSKSGTASAVPVTESTASTVQKTSQSNDPKSTEPMAVIEETHKDNQPKKTIKAQADDITQVSNDTQASDDKDDDLIPKAAHDATKR
jgi:intermembrane space import and assembly protein 40